MNKNDAAFRDKMRNRNVTLRILRYIRPETGYVILSLLCALVTTASQLVVPILCGRGIDAMLGKGGVDFEKVKTMLLMILAMAAAGALSQWIQAVCNNHITFRVSRNLRNQAMSKIQKLPLSYLDAHLSGDLVSRIIADIDLFSDGLLMSFTQFFTGILTILGTVIFMVAVNWKIALVIIVLTPLSLFVARFIVSKTQHYFKQQALVRGEETAMVNEQIEGLGVVQAFGHEEQSLKDFDRVNERLRAVSLKAVFYSSLTNPSTRLVNNIVYAAVALAGALFAVAGKLTVGTLSIFLSYASQYAKPFNEISGVLAEMQNSVTCAGRIFDLLDEPEEIVSPDETENIACDGRVGFDNVFFSYHKDRPLIENFNLQVGSGQRIAIVGPTGCGKTTLINLLMRFYDVDSGKITLSGEDIRRIHRHTLRDCYGMVLQDTWLRSGTVRENIAYGKEDASEEEIIAAAKKAHAHSFIMRMSKGYDTVITEDGSNISQGQKQLLCIARVMLSMPDMLILDEATSSIDTRTELKIQAAFLEMMEGRTSFIVAHRLSTIREADVILVMNAGKIIEQGNHTELLKKDGFYAKLYNSQFAAV